MLGPPRTRIGTARSRPSGAAPASGSAFGRPWWSAPVPGRLSAAAARRFTRRATGEAIILAGGGCAILLQLADPRVAHAVARHSEFDTAPLRRLDGTLAYVTAIVHGDAADRAFVRRQVAAAHAPVHGTFRDEVADDDDARASAAVGTDANERTRTYDANDADAQRWVAATLYWTAREVLRCTFGRLSPSHDELLLRGFAPVGTALRMPAEAWPATVDDFDAWFATSVGRARVTAAARESHAKLLRASGAPRWLRAFVPLVNLLALGLLPSPVRRGFAPNWGRAHRFAFELAWVCIVVPYRCTPRAVRMLPVRVILARLRRRSGEARAKLPSPGGLP